MTINEKHSQEEQGEEMLASVDDEANETAHEDEFDDK